MQHWKGVSSPKIPRDLCISISDALPQTFFWLPQRPLLNLIFRRRRHLPGCGTVDQVFTFARILGGSSGLFKCLKTTFVMYPRISWHSQSKENFIRLPHLTCTGKVLIWVVSGLDKCQCPQNWGHCPNTLLKQWIGPLGQVHQGVSYSFEFKYPRVLFKSQGKMEGQINRWTRLFLKRGTKVWLPKSWFTGSSKFQPSPMIMSFE